MKNKTHNVKEKIHVSCIRRTSFFSPPERNEPGGKTKVLLNFMNKLIIFHCSPVGSVADLRELRSKTTKSNHS